MDYQVDIGAQSEIGPGSIGNYISSVYTIAMGAVGALAVVVMMFGGIMWMMSGGSQERIQSAKGWIFGAMSGLVLAFSSYAILYLINPKLVQFASIDIFQPLSRETVNNRTYSKNCSYSMSSCATINSNYYKSNSPDADCGVRGTQLGDCCCAYIQTLQTVPAAGRTLNCGTVQVGVTFANLGTCTTGTCVNNVCTP